MLSLQIGHACANENNKISIKVRMKINILPSITDLDKTNSHQESVAMFPSKVTNFYAQNWNIA